MKVLSCAVDTNKEGHQHSNWEKWNRRGEKNWFAFSLSCELSRSFLGLVQFREIVPEKTEDEKKTEKKVLFVNERWWWYYVIRTSRGGLTWAQISRPVQKQQHNVLYWPKDTYTQNKTNFRTIFKFFRFFLWGFYVYCWAIGANLMFLTSQNGMRKRKKGTTIIISLKKKKESLRLCCVYDLNNRHFGFYLIRWTRHTLTI